MCIITELTLRTNSNHNKCQNRLLTQSGTLNQDFLDYKAVTLTAILRHSASFNYESTKHNLPFYAFFTDFRKHNGKVVSVFILKLPKFSMDFDEIWYCGRTFSNLGHHQTVKVSSETVHRTIHRQPCITHDTLNVFNVPIRCKECLTKCKQK